MDAAQKKHVEGFRLGADLNLMISPEPRMKSPFELMLMGLVIFASELR